MFRHASRFLLSQDLPPFECACRFFLFRLLTLLVVDLVVGLGLEQQSLRAPVNGRLEGETCICVQCRFAEGSTLFCVLALPSPSGCGVLLLPARSTQPLSFNALISASYLYLLCGVLLWPLTPCCCSIASTWVPVDRTCCSLVNAWQPGGGWKFGWWFAGGLLLGKLVVVPGGTGSLCWKRVRSWLCEVSRLRVCFFSRRFSVVAAAQDVGARVHPTEGGRRNDACV